MLVTMWCSWTPFALLWVSMVTPALCQSGDGDWGSGFVQATNDTSQVAGDEPVRTTNSQKVWITSAATSPAPTLLTDAGPDKCSVFFNTDPAFARRLKAQREQVAYLQAIQHGNRAVMENLAQYVGAELGDQSYEDVIKENIVGTREDQKSCQEVLDKAVEDLEKQLEGDVSEAVAGMQKIREESRVFNDMLGAAADVASRLERSSQALHASFTRQLKHMVDTHR
ncbi:uncharacterized protein LOC142999275 [Genypterus blacodes]|uniref:uncharacterized protein LOC142999275 n=1 Tax=Genypterus blacodes TaxID=154954 RepID=UPI003F77707A